MRAELGWEWAHCTYTYVYAFTHSIVFNELAQQTAESLLVNRPDSPTTTADFRCGDRVDWMTICCKIAAAGGHFIFRPLVPESRSHTVLQFIMDPEFLKFALNFGSGLPIFGIGIPFGISRPGPTLLYSL